MFGIEILAMAFLAGCAAKFARDHSDGLGSSADTDEEESSGSSYSGSSWRNTLPEIKPLAFPVFDPPQARKVIDFDRFDRIDRDPVHVELPPLSSLLPPPPVREIDIDRLCRERPDRDFRPFKYELEISSPTPILRSFDSSLIHEPIKPRRIVPAPKLHGIALLAPVALPPARDPLEYWKPAIKPISRPFVEDMPTLKPMPFPPLFPRSFEPTTLPRGPDPFASWRW